MKKVLESIIATCCLSSISAHLNASESICKQYWDSRSQGKDWVMEAPLSQYDSLCLAKLVVAKDWIGNCAVYSIKEIERENYLPPRYCDSSSHNPSCWKAPVPILAFEWFSCQQNGEELSVGDVIP